MFDLYALTINSFFVFALVLIRVSGLCVVAPVIGGSQIPIQIRTLFALSLALVIFPMMKNAPELSVPVTFIGLALVVFKELVLGMFIGFFVSVIFLGFEMGGRFVSVHMGMSMARMLDPFSGKQSSVIGQLFGLLTMTAFVLIDGHHMMLKAVMYSFENIPLSGVVFTSELLSETIKSMNIVIYTALKIAMPMMGALFAINMLFGFIARLVPKMNVFILSLPVKIAAGVFLTVIVLPSLINLFIEVMQTVYTDLFSLLRVMH